ncbi:MAG: outer membrane protein assembly factor BamA [Desulfobacterales bacterium]|jgi:outer membrane protein insertion porin family|nr:outer membrane protein assembly factor BamA [Desulfobacterales bacterium]
MKMMIRRLSIFWTIWMLVWAGTALSAESVRVMSLPFDVRSQRDMSYLSTEIPRIIQENLAAEGADIVAAPEIPAGNLQRLFDDVKSIRQLAGRSNANYVIWGRLVFEGNSFKLIARLAAVPGLGEPEDFQSSGEGIEVLSGAVRSLSGEIADKLFQRVRITELRVAGNQRIEADAITMVIKSKVGDMFSAKRLSLDLKAIYAMGYFEDIRIESLDGPTGRIVTFHVTEKPTVKSIGFKGNVEIREEKLREDVDIKVGSILNIKDIQKNIERIEVAYKEKKFFNVKVTYETKALKDNQVDLIFVVEEGKQVQIKEIKFSGNKAYSEKKLKKTMKTAEKGFFSWITSAGDFNADVLKQDMAALMALYHNSGYIQARIGEPEVVQEQESIFITIKIEEGDRYKVGKVDVDGDLILPKETLLAAVQIGKEAYFNRDVLRKDMLALNDLYSNFGYANADAAPNVQQNPETKEVNVTYVLDKGNKVYFDKILIEGNSKTRDKVIRRELEVQEQSLYNGALLNRSVRNLHRLNFFEDVKADTAKGDKPDSVNLKVKVTEKPTGSFTFGGGYSSVEDVFVTASVSQENLFGRGQALNLRALLGGTTTQAMLSFTEPWLFDIPLSCSTSIYNWTRDYDEYERDSAGGSVRLSYPIFTDVRLFGGYAFDIGEITNVYWDAPQDIKELEGKFTTSSVNTGITYDTRDKIINPTRGHNHRLSLEYAGIGGDIGYSKVTGELGYYHPLFWGTVGFAHFETGYVSQNSGMVLPDYEKFYLGGINSVRGFDWRDIHLWSEPVDHDENPLTPDVPVEMGGEAMLQFNVEWIFPIAQSAGIVGVVFYDMGNVYEGLSEVDFGELRKTTGVGVRWYSPMGPIRIEYGHILDKKDSDDSDGRWEFTMGTAF